MINDTRFTIIQAWGKASGSGCRRPLNFKGCIIVKRVS